MWKQTMSKRINTCQFNNKRYGFLFKLLSLGSNVLSLKTGNLVPQKIFLIFALGITSNFSSENRCA